MRGKTAKKDKENAIARLKYYHATTRRLIVTISSTKDLWYLKKDLKNNKLSEKHGLIIIFAVMHRLSELSRYDPNGLDKHLCGDANWLLTQFI